MSATKTFEVVTVTLNPAIDRTVTVRNFAAGAVNRAESAESSPGGKGVNVALTLADVGHRVSGTGFLGAANAGAFESVFAERGVDDGFVRIAGSTRVGIKIVDPETQETTDLNFPGLTPSETEQRELLARIDAVEAEWFVIAGSLPVGVSGDFYREVILRLRGRGAHVILDASGEALRRGLEAGPTVVKPNVAELEELVGQSLVSEAEVAEAARVLVLDGVELAVISMGERGAIFVTASEAILAVPPTVRVASTVGAGDAMVSGVVSARLRGLSLADTARLATAFSVHALQRIGAGLSSSAAISATTQQVEIRPLSQNNP